MLVRFQRSARQLWDPRGLAGLVVVLWARVAVVVNHHLVRVGLLGRVGRFTSPSGQAFPRGRRVVCRTVRGLEVGTILGESAKSDAALGMKEQDQRPTPRESDLDGAVLRLVSPEDDLLLARLERNQHEAFSACSRLLEERRIPAMLVDVEHLFDGTALYFYFLGEVGPEVDALTTELAQAYEAKAELQRFADVLQQGCGPGCGTEEASGCGSSGGCSTCSIAAACKKPGH